MSQPGAIASADKQLCSHCKQPFRSGARLCANCGNPRPRKQPQGPPCMYCEAPLGKHDAKVCVKCGRPQPGRSSENSRPVPGQSSGGHSSLTQAQNVYPPNSELVVSRPSKPLSNKTPRIPQDSTLNTNYQNSSVLSQQQQLNNNEQPLLSRTSNQHGGGVSITDYKVEQNNS